MNCQECGRKVVLRFACLKKDRKFCSNPCRMRGLHRGNIKLRSKLTCSTCGKKFVVERGPHLEKIQKHCSKKCGNEAGSKKRKGFLNGHWKGGVSSSTQEYAIVTHGPDANRLIHRIVMEKHIGRRLLPTEIVHHINHNKLDNRIKNLTIMTRAEHASHHLKDRWRQSNRRSYP